jgi:heme-degrading monooxygenase HmoA
MFAEALQALLKVLEDRYNIRDISPFRGFSEEANGEQPTLRNNPRRSWGRLKFMHIILWKFTVREERVQEFTGAYGSDGDWAQLFRRAEGYRGTQLLRSGDDPNIFVTVDRWDSAACFETFQKRYGEEYKKLDARFEAYTLSEEKMGAFSEA